MQEQNVISIAYFEDPARVADLLNGYIYQGQEILRPEDVRVEERSIARIGRKRKHPASQKAGGNSHPYAQVVTADIVREVTHGMRVTVIAIENQTDIHYAMPVRVINLESMNYHRQWQRTSKRHRRAKDLSGAEFLSGFSKGDKLTPVITVVVYFGSKPWDGPTSLREMMELEDYPPELKDLIEDYHIHLLEVRKYEKLNAFRTDLQYVFGFLQNENSKDGLAEYVRANEEFFTDLSEDAYDMISVMSHSEELVNVRNTSKTDGGNNMCRAIKEMIEDGRQEGRQEGRQDGMRAFVEACLELGVSRENILLKLREKFGLGEDSEMVLAQYEQ